MAASLAVALKFHTAVRAPLTLTFLFVCPGLALVRLLAFDDFVAQLSLAVALSLALDVLIPSILLYAGAWSAPVALYIIVALTVVVAVGEFAFKLRGRGRTDDEGSRVTTQGPGVPDR